MIGDYFLEHKATLATVTSETADTVLRCLVLDALDELIYDGTRVIDNNTALELAIERASLWHRVTLPAINRPNNNDTESLSNAATYKSTPTVHTNPNSNVDANVEGEYGEATGSEKMNNNGEITNDEESYDHPNNNDGDNE